MKKTDQDQVCVILIFSFFSLKKEEETSECIYLHCKLKGYDEKEREGEKRDEKKPN